VEPAATLIDDFERSALGEGWDTWTDGGETTLDCRLDTEIAHSGTASLSIEYSIAPGGWAGCGRAYETPQNWSEALGLSMWLHASESGQEVVVSLHLGDPEDHTPFEGWFEAPPGTVGDWGLVELPWHSFIKPDWFGEGGLAEFDPSRVVGISFDFGAEDDTRNDAELWLDDIALSVEGPDVTPISISATEEAEGGGISGICPLSTLSLPLAAVGLIYWRRSKRL